MNNRFQLEIKQLTNVVNGTITNSYSRHFNYLINKKFKAIKEWDFYQIQNETNVLQLCIGHLSYVSNVSANFFTLDGKVKKSVTYTKLFPKMKLEDNPEVDHHLEVIKKDFIMSFNIIGDKRYLKVCTPDFNVDICLISIKNSDKMVILVPFIQKNKFYLNYKENGYRVNGSVIVNDIHYEYNDESFGLLDCGRGVWPYKNKWYWGNGSYRYNNHIIGINIGYGFGITKNATENAIFIDGIMIKLGIVQVIQCGKSYMSECHFVDENDLVNLVFSPMYDNYTKTDYLVVKMECHQVFGKLNGTIKYDSQIIEINNMVFFFERCNNRW